MFDVESEEVALLDYIKPYRPQLMDTSAHQLNRLLAGGRIFEGLFADNPAHVCALPFSDDPLVSPRAFRVTLSQCEFYVQLGADALQLAASQLQIPDQLDHLGGALRDAVFVAFIEAFAGQLFGVVPLSITALASDHFANGRLNDQLQGLKVEISLAAQSNVNFRVFIHPDFVPVVVEWLAKLQTQMRDPVPALAQIPISTQCILDEFFVAQSVAQNLQLGDVIITDAHEHEVLVRVAGRLQQKGRLMDDNLTLDGYLEEFEQEMASVAGQDRNAVGQTGVKLAQASAYQTPGFEEARDLFQELPVQMTFQLHQTKLSLEALRQLNTGQCIPLPSKSPGDIVIALNGQVFAKGELVRIEDQIGVKITKFTD